jgi:lysophospholipase L1-like esterase
MCDCILNLVLRRILRPFVSIVLLAVASNLLLVPLSAQIDKYDWYDLSKYGIEGKGWSETKEYYDRLPATAEKSVRSKVWELSHDSSGMCFRFVTDADSIGARWTLTSDELQLVHMPSSGVSGLDLYVKDNGHWRWLGFGWARKKGENTRLLVSGKLNPGKREYLLYLPLYNGVHKVEIGLPPGSHFLPAPSYPPGTKPIVFYGTSITQGGVASRPGMAYPAILGRALGYPTINLGFSGNGQAEPEVAALLAQLDPAIYVLDPLPNLSPAQVTERMPAFIRILRAAHPKTPIVLVESLVYPDGRYIEDGRGRRYRESNAALAALYKELLHEGEKNVLYIKGEELLGDDGEDTVDGTHPTDLGLSRMAKHMEPVLRAALDLSGASR